MNKLIGLLVLLAPWCCIADTVVPIDAVEKSVNIRLSPDASSEIVGKLEQGSSAELVNSIDGWYEIKLVGDASGFISADWARVVTGEEVAAVAPVVEEVVVAVVESATDAVAEVAAVPAAEVTVAGVAEEAAVEEPVVEEAVVDEVIVESETVPEAVAEEVVAPVVVEVVEEVVQPEKATQTKLKGTKNYLVKFRGEAEGGNSQIFDDGNQIGIGTTEPKQRLEVNGSIQIHEQNSSVAGLMITQSSGDTGYIMHNRASTLTIGAGSQDRITIDRDGNVGIAVSRPKHPLEMASGAHVTAGGVWTNSSSREKKENIAALQLDAATSALMALEPVIFNYKNEVDEDYVGFIAEDVPELVAIGDRNALSTMDIVAVLTRVVQEQQNKIKELEARLDAL